MQGFYGVYYTGDSGAGAFGLLLHDGRVYGIDSQGGEINGTYAERSDGGLDLALAFSWPAGAVLVTGQILQQTMNISADVTISAETLSGGYQPVDLPIGRVNVRVSRKVSL